MSKDEIMEQIEGAELTEEQLEMIAGGKDNTIFAMPAISFLVSLAAGIAV